LDRENYEAAETAEAEERRPSLGFVRGPRQKLRNTIIIDELPQD
jgi:hypothetical protein